jgi:tRNA (adenine57-N1/adenine58-N1)-methyltransferase
MKLLNGTENKKMEGLTYINGERTVLKSPYTTAAGKLDAADIGAAKNGEELLTSKGDAVRFLKPTFRDFYYSMKRGAQPITPKDCAAILAETLVGKESKVFDCGAGMGGLTCFLARYVKHVYSCDNRPEHLSTVKKNVEKLSLSNVTLIEHDIYESFPKIPQMDLITLDLQRPADVIGKAKKYLKFGAFVVAYCPQATQMHDFFLSAEKEGFIVTTVKKIVEEHWKVGERILRPENMGLMHTGFLIFARKV